MKNVLKNTVALLTLLIGAVIMTSCVAQRAPSDARLRPEEPHLEALENAALGKVPEKVPFLLHDVGVVENIITQNAVSKDPKASTVVPVAAAEPEISLPAVKTVPSGAKVPELILKSNGNNFFVNGSNFVGKFRLSSKFRYLRRDFGEEGLYSAIHHNFLAEQNLLDELGSDRQSVIRADGAGRLELRNLQYGDYGEVFYLEFDLVAEEAYFDCRMFVGTNGPCKIWKDGELVYTYDRVRRDYERDQDQISNLELKRGVNRFLIKGSSMSEPWQFSLRFASGTGVLWQIVEKELK